MLPGCVSCLLYGRLSLITNTCPDLDLDLNLDLGGAGTIFPDGARRGDPCAQRASASARASVLRGGRHGTCGRHRFT